MSMANRHNHVEILKNGNKLCRIDIPRACLQLQCIKSSEETDLHLAGQAGRSRLPSMSLTRPSNEEATDGKSSDRSCGQERVFVCCCQGWECFDPSLSGLAPHRHSLPTPLSPYPQLQRPRERKKHRSSFYSIPHSSIQFHSSFQHA